MERYTENTRLIFQVQSIQIYEHVQNYLVFIPHSKNTNEQQNHIKCIEGLAYLAQSLLFFGSAIQLIVCVCVWWFYNVKNLKMCKLSFIVSQ